jgi:hypothetical protein
VQRLHTDAQIAAQFAKRRRQVKLVLVERNLKPFYSHR